MIAPLFPWKNSWPSKTRLRNSSGVLAARTEQRWVINKLASCSKIVTVKMPRLPILRRESIVKVSRKSEAYLSSASRKCSKKFKTAQRWPIAECSSRRWSNWRRNLTRAFLRSESILSLKMARTSFTNARTPLLFSRKISRIKLDRVVSLLSSKTWVRMSNHSKSQGWWTGRGRRRSLILRGISA